MNAGELFENVVFAMNLSDEVPQRILDDVFKKNKDKNKSKNVEHELETIQEFNQEVERKLGHVQNQGAEEFFDSVIGYGDIKKLLLRCIQSSDKEPVHVILDGPPASAKSMFLEAMKNKLEDVHYIDCTNATGPGLVDFLFDNDVKFLLLDEVEKMSDSDQNVLLNVMERGVLTSTKVRHTGDKEMKNLSIYATTNYIDEISKPFRSRFMEFSLPEYTEEDFKNIAVKLLGLRYEHSEALALKIADTVWNKIGSKDVRDMLQIAKLSKNVEDVDFVATTLQKYKRREEC